VGVQEEKRRGAERNCLNEIKGRREGVREFSLMGLLFNYLLPTT